MNFQQSHTNVLETGTQMGLIQVCCSCVR